MTAYYSSGDDNKPADEKNNGFDLQTAYAVANSWALTASYFSRRERDVYSYKEYNFFDSSVVNYRRRMMDFGGGYFVPLDNRKSVFFNIYGGLGFGKFSFTDAGKDNAGANYSRVHSSKVTKWFFQPAFNFLPGEYFRFSLVGKFSFIHYANISTSYTSEELKYFDLNRLTQRAFNFFEPTLNMQLEVPECDWLKIDGGFTFSSNPFNSSNIEARTFNASIGLSFDLSKLKK